MGKGSAPRPFTDRAVFEDNFDKIFGKQKTVDPLPKETPHKILKQSRIDTIGFNGNDGLHYDKAWDEMKPVGLEILPEYELNKSTGEVEKRFIDGVSKPNESQFDE
jgi:hypothetical protein